MTAPKLLGVGLLATAGGLLMTLSAPAGAAETTSAARAAAPAEAAAASGPSAVSTSARRDVRVQVAQWAQPFLRVRNSPGWPGGQPGDVIGTMRPGAPASAVCWTKGADMTAYGRTGSIWIKIRLGSPPTAWVWDGGLNPHAAPPPCGGCDRSAPGGAAGPDDCPAREEEGR
ncbi:SH3 domain-containing protein [Actinomadura rifamycini]|uniref:SH3 domain-containing protein n=1 Tax=Actinomadura rifamycini TaxID=31962 RepID=UPI00041DE2C0|nr:SH3 domain-containing protein [Actinomadura rifamycini]